MSERRSLIEGIKTVSLSADSRREQEFVYGSSTKGADEAPIAAHSTSPIVTVNRAHFSTRMRSDLVAALKRASLERQLAGVEPNTLQDMIEQAVEPWLKSNGYLS